MRQADYINNLWGGGGPFVGDEGKPHTIVTVQRPWDGDDDAVRDGDEDHVIHPTWTKTGTGQLRGLPMRWYQKADDSQNEAEVPNIKQVTIDRSIDSDASTCQINLYNQWMYDNGLVPLSQLTEGNRGLSGYFTPTRGAWPEGQARWGHEANEWEDTLVPNAILRTYQGFGGHDKTLEDCLLDGNLILTGIWLVDEVRVSTSGELELQCRDMAKLLVDQQLYPPLVPSKKYPLSYYRWVTDNFAVRAAAKKITTSTSVNVTKGDKRCVFRDSEVDHWYPQGATGSRISTGGYVLHGHQGRHAVDGNNGTYYLGVGNNGPDRTFSVMWWEGTCGEYIDAVYMKPWAGNYTMYVSVYENGRWQGASTIPYSEAELVGNQPYVVDTGADIPYVAKFGVPWETGKEYKLPRYYKADRVRITFRHLAYSGIGPWMYRGGIREVRFRSTQTAKVTTGTSSQTIQPIFYAGDALLNPDNLNATGYITSSHMGQVDAFGDMRVLNKTGGNLPSSHSVIWLETTRAGSGYWILRIDGTITCYGDAPYYGSPAAEGVATAGDNRWYALVQTASGHGYWVIKGDGTIRSYGDAPTYTNLAIPGGELVSAANSLYGSNGFWAIDTEGTVYARGAAVHHGHFTEAACTNGSNALRIGAYIVGTSTDAGYWTLSSDGRVQAHGDAVSFGQVLTPTRSTSAFERWFHIFPAPSDDGYLLMRGDGFITPFGDVEYFGAPIPGSTGQLRRNGNYLDYSDIIKDLALWAGFLLYDEGIGASAAPAVYGNIETTGSYAEEQLPDEIFDKRPVIDAMTEIKEAVGYLLFVDDEGGLRFESPNFWAPGNFLQGTGEHTDVVPEIDEKVNLIDYGASRNDESLRSLIIISSEDPNEAGDTTVTTKIVPQTATGLRGLLKPAMWVNGWFQNEDDQKIMAELIALHIWFAQRIGQVTCVANPAVQINDQVRIYERQTAELFMHYVRGINTNHSLDSGEYTMTLTTHWLGSGEDWAITDSPAYVESDDHFVVSARLVSWLKGTQSGSSSELQLGRATTTNPTYVAIDPNGTDGSPTDRSGPA